MYFLTFFHINYWVVVFGVESQDKMIPPEALETTVKYFIIVLSYGAIGGSLKYIDQAFDAGMFSKKIATLLAVPTALLMGALMVLDSSSATIFLAIVIAVGVTQKIDTIAFRVGVFILILVPVIFRQFVEIQWLPFGLLILAGIIDEYSNDWADKMINGKPNAFQYRSLPSRVSARVFLQRPLVKLLILLLTLSGFFHPIYFIAFIAFDIVYSLIAWVSVRYKLYRLNAAPMASETPIGVKRAGLSAL